MARFESLRAWQKARELTLVIYPLSAMLPPGEQFGLTSQMRRAAVSAMANLAEGRERESEADFAHFVTIAAGSVAEVQNYLILARDLGYLKDEDLDTAGTLAAETLRVIRALRESIRASQA